MSEAHRRQPHHEQAGRTADPFLPKSPWPKAESISFTCPLALHTHYYSRSSIWRDLSNITPDIRSHLLRSQWIDLLCFPCFLATDTKNKKNKNWHNRLNFPITRTSPYRAPTVRILRASWPAERRYSQMTAQHNSTSNCNNTQPDTDTQEHTQIFVTQSFIFSHTKILYKDGTCPGHLASIRDEENGRSPRQEREDAEAEPQTSTPNLPWDMRQPEHIFHSLPTVPTFPTIARRSCLRFQRFLRFLR